MVSLHASHVILQNAVSFDGRILGFTMDITLCYELSALRDVDRVPGESSTLLAAAQMFSEETGAMGQSDPPFRIQTTVGPCHPQQPGVDPKLAHLAEGALLEDIVVLCSRSTHVEHRE